MKSTVKLTKLEPISNTQLKKPRKYENLGTKWRSEKLCLVADIDVSGAWGLDKPYKAIIYYYIDDTIMVGIRGSYFTWCRYRLHSSKWSGQCLPTIQGAGSFPRWTCSVGRFGITIVEFEWKPKAIRVLQDCSFYHSFVLFWYVQTSTIHLWKWISNSITNFGRRIIRSIRCWLHIPLSILGSNLKFFQQFQQNTSQPNKHFSDGYPRTSFAKSISHPW